MIVVPGEKLPATYLERFDPVENAVYRISVLSTAAIAVEFHWVDIPSKQIKATHQCIQGICCQAFGRRSQTYNVPIYVYKNPQQGSTEGEIQTWQMTPARWKKFSDLALQADLTQWDLTFTSAKRGLGLDWSYSVLPDCKFRDYWTPEQKEQLRIAVESYYQMGEASLVTPMTYNDWAQLLYDLGYDLQNQCWPGGQSPMNSGTAFSAVGRALSAGAPALPPAPPNGFSPVVPQVPGVGGVVFQPPQPQAGFIPNRPQQVTSGTGFPISHPQITNSVSVGAVPVQAPPVVNPQPTPAYVQPVGTPVAQPVQPPQAPHLYAATAGFTPAVPLGTAPVMPAQAHLVPPVQPVHPAPQNEVGSMAMEITADELNKLIM